MSQKMKLALLAAALTLGASTAGHAQNPIKIGYINTLSGPIGLIGQDMYDGFMLKVEQGGGKLGGFPVQILKNDDQLKPELATQIVEKLIEKDNVPIITGIAASNVMMAIYKPIIEKQVFIIGANAGPSPIAGAMCSPFFFSASWQNDSWAVAAGKYANDKGYKRMALIAPNYQAGKDALAGFKRLFKGTVVEEIYPGLTQPDFSAEITQIASLNVDAVYAFLPGGGVNFIRQYQQAGLLKKLPLLTSGTVDGTSLPTLKETALGIQATHYWAPDTDTAISKKFVEDFEKKYNRIPSYLAAQGYESGLLLDAAIERVKGNVTDKEAFKAALKQGVANSLRGPLKFGNNNIPINNWYAFEAVKDAKGRMSLKTIAMPLTDYQDAYHDLCPMK
jgi:branched-chain amino acid transport system substrate-binding protein